MDPVTADVAFCGSPAWVAFQDGDGAWTRALPTTTAPVAAFHYTFTTDRAAIAVAREVGGGLTALSILYGRPDELSIVDDTAGVACGEASFRTVRGTVVGIDTNEIARLNAGRGVDGGFVSIGTGPEFELRGLAPGPHDILATRLRLVNARTVISGIVLRRTPDLPDQTILDPIDFRSAEAFLPAARTLTLTGADADGATGFVGLRTVHGIAGELSTLTNAAGTATTQYSAIPDEHLVTGDLQNIVMTSRPSPSGLVRSAAVYFHSATDRSLAFGSAPNAPLITVASTGPSLRMRARFDAARDYDRSAAVSFQQGQSTIVAVVMTAAYAASNPSGYDLTIPELASVDGFDPRWGLKPGGALLWTTTRVGGTLGLGLNAVPVDGSTRRIATQGGNFTPY